MNPLKTNLKFIDTRSLPYGRIIEDFKPGEEVCERDSGRIYTVIKTCNGSHSLLDSDYTTQKPKVCAVYYLLTCFNGSGELIPCGKPTPGINLQRFDVLEMADQSLYIVVRCNGSIELILLKNFWNCDFETTSPGRIDIEAEQYYNKIGYYTSKDAE